MRNIEIKARVRDESHIRDYMRTHATRHETQHQRDVFFHPFYGRLKLRCFPDGTGVLVAYHRPDRSGPKVSDYLLTPVPDAATCEAVLARALGVRGIVEKKREIAIVEQTRIHLDEVRNLGLFLELEVILRPDQDHLAGEAIANDLMRDLKIEPADLLQHAYIDLLEQRG
jgi:predicted adenylyl cyclase CyaB